MTAWSRVTIVGEERRVDAVLPANEPVGVLMPEVLELLGDEPQNPARLRHLVTASGVVLVGESTLEEGRIEDGSVLWLIRDEAPVPAPVVHEVPEAVSQALDDHSGRWNPAAARWSATIALAVLFLGAAWLVHGHLPGGTGLAVLAAVAVALVAIGAAIGPTWREPLGTALAIGGAVVGVYTLWSAGAHFDWPHWALWGGAAALVSGLLLLLGLTSGLGRGGLAGGGVGLALAAVWSLSRALDLTTDLVAVILTVICVIGLSLLLRVALMISGLAVLDDRRGSGEPVTRVDVLTAVARAHRSLVIATVAVAVAAAVAGLGLVTNLTPWTAGLSVVLAIVVASRSRQFPLIAQKVSLLAASLVVLIALLLAWAGEETWAVWPALGVILAVTVIPVVVLATEQPEHVRARLRGVTARFEVIAVIVMVPLAVGAFGTFERLLATF
ncbi:type VII secretion integral membrane protein EccD [Nocardiopsis sp. MG754419]|uniref:type VII secretion integral membrane protein EccD n=1 Tax=Nocardiopsis sp. MG754419 TaxID=2259865 RepID=UPI001BA716B2|nr:type VII secretion integral membrane protein EccD [Nocardiopsis sp. MG754419]MBR8740981.1 type VII secretion integral membrane protein EccD [Nocardiopsis sp. MG754419]